MKKMLAMVMAVVMLVCGTSVVYATEPPENAVMPCYNMIQETSITLSISSTGLATIKVRLEGDAATTDRLQVISYLERKVGSSWVRVEIGLTNNWWRDAVEGSYLNKTHTFQLTQRGTYRAMGCFASGGDLPMDYVEIPTASKTY